MNKPDAPVRLTEGQVAIMRSLVAGIPGHETRQELRRLLDSHDAQARELAEARKLIEGSMDSWACTCHWCNRVRAWLAATAQEESDD